MTPSFAQALLTCNAADLRMQRLRMVEVLEGTACIALRMQVQLAIQALDELISTTEIALKMARCVADQESRGPNDKPVNTARILRMRAIHRNN